MGGVYLFLIYRGRLLEDLRYWLEIEVMLITFFFLFHFSSYPPFKNVEVNHDIPCLVFLIVHAFSSCGL